MKVFGRIRKFLILVTILQAVCFMFYSLRKSTQFDTKLETATSTTPDPTSPEAHHLSFPYILNKPNKCSSQDRLKLVIVVESAVLNFQERLAVRQTWGMAAMRQDVALIFLLGIVEGAHLQMMILQEDTIYSDIVQGDFKDTYSNLTLKSTLLLSWVNSFCRNADYVVKVDDDHFINVQNLLDHLNVSRNTSKVIYGYKWLLMPIIRDNSSRYYVSEEQLEGKVYPDYTSGHCYVISIDSVPLLLDATDKVDFIPMEDAYITGMCAEYANITRVHSNKFLVKAFEKQPCSFRHFITAHRFIYVSFYDVWNFINNPKFPCPKWPGQHKNY